MTVSLVEGTVAPAHKPATGSCRPGILAPAATLQGLSATQSIRSLVLALLSPAYSQLVAFATPLGPVPAGNSN